jgi:hypothetical protein
MWGQASHFLLFMDQNNFDNQNEPFKPETFEPWGALADYMGQYCIISRPDKTGDLEVLKAKANRFLSNGRTVEIPHIVENHLGDSAPFRLYPRCAIKVINACVKVLEKEWEQKIAFNKNHTPEEEKTLEGVLCLADQLFPLACSDPEQGLNLHTVREIRKKNGVVLEKPHKEISLSYHAKSLKQLATRLEQYRDTKNKLTQSDLPPISCRQVLLQELRNSEAQWRLIDPKNWDGRTPQFQMDSLDAMKENIGFEGVSNDGPDAEENQESIQEKYETQESEIDQAAWTGLPIQPSAKFEETRRGNLLFTAPKQWIWNYNEDPLEFLTNYTTTHSKIALENAYSLLCKAYNNPDLKNLGTQALTLDHKSKNNPDSFWKIIKRMNTHFPASLEFESDHTIQKLDCARFHLSLETINHKFGIDSALFKEKFQEKVFEAIRNEEDSITRSQLLFNTLEEIHPEWTTMDKEIWLENLQSYAAGAYENSAAMENERQKLLATLNQILKVPRQEIEMAARTNQPNNENTEKVFRILQNTSSKIYEMLSGTKGQMIRRELKTKIYSLKTLSENKGEMEMAEKFGKTAKFISSVSSQVKNKSWYTNEKENKKIVLDFLIDMLASPKLGDVEFPGSSEPEPKNVLDITLEFLKTYANDQAYLPTGKTSIQALLNSAREYAENDEGGRLESALKQITSTKLETVAAAKNKSILNCISENLSTLTAAIKISEVIADIDNQKIPAISEELQNTLTVELHSFQEKINSLEDPLAITQFLSQENIAEIKKQYPLATHQENFKIALVDASKTKILKDTVDSLKIELEGTIDMPEEKIEKALLKSPTLNNLLSSAFKSEIEYASVQSISKEIHHQLEILKTPVTVDATPEQIETLGNSEKFVNSIEKEGEYIQAELEKRKLKSNEFTTVCQKIDLCIQSIQKNNLNPEQEQRVLKTLAQFQAAQTKTRGDNLYFWKGIQYISQNIQSRREANIYQVSDSGKGTLQNIVAIAKGKLQNKDISQRTADLGSGMEGATETLRQFLISKTRERAVLTNIGVPIALWLSEEERGTKTKLTKSGFIDLLKGRQYACKICLDMTENDQSLHKKLSDYKMMEEDNKNAINTSVITQCMEMLEDPAALAKSLRWQNQNPTKAEKISKAHPEYDTPLLRYTAFSDGVLQTKEEPDLIMG